MPKPHSTKLNAPGMSDDDIKLFEQVIEAQVNNYYNDIKFEVLEWGCGYSTKYFSDKLAHSGINYEWNSVENEQKWKDKILSLEPKNVNITIFEYLMPEGEDRRYYKRPSVKMDEYVDFPKSLNRQFDFIFIDGYKRRRCLLEALSLLKPNGIVLVHDAQRKWYHCAFEKYDGKFLSETLWMGRLKKFQ